MELPPKLPFVPGIIIKLPEKINSFDIQGQSDLTAAPEWKRTLPRAFESRLGIVESTPEGTRYTKEHPAETPDGNSPLDCCI